MRRLRAPFSIGFPSSQPAVTGFDDRDRRALEAHGLPLKEAERQLALLLHPPRPAPLDRPCTPGDGIRGFEVDDPALLDSWQLAAQSGRLSKFVPASGAATRMFRDLLEARRRDDPTTSEEARLFRDRFDDLALSEWLPSPHPTDLKTLLAAVLDSDGLALADLPKGLLPFHRTASGVQTAFEEHLAEGARILSSGAPGAACRLHFTVSQQHQGSFEETLAVLGPALQERYDVQFDVDFSLQSPATDTVALDSEGSPFRDSDGVLVFRPGGHGALIANLQQLADDGHDLIVIKNIDNILPAERQQTSIATQRALVGLLATLEARVHSQLAALESPSPRDLEDAVGLLAELGRPEARSLLDLAPEARRTALIERLDRPLRVCGVVRNEGDPGGGPFWVRERGESGASTPQIVETAQIDREDPEQSAILSAATHFNPVLLACALRTADGEPFELARFVDPDTAFLAQKSHEGRVLQALEHPGLWNGAMAHWNTVFVEVLTQVFAPVKTFADLLGDAHRTGR